MKYLVLACFAGHTDDDNELWTNQWLVGTFDSLEECCAESEKDLEQVARDSLECRFENEEEFEREVQNYLSTKEMICRTDLDFKEQHPAIILSNDYWTNDHHEIIDYIVVKIN